MKECICCLDAQAVKGDYCLQCRSAIGILYLQRSVDLQRQCEAEIAVSARYWSSWAQRQRVEESVNELMASLGITSAAITLDDVSEIFIEVLGLPKETFADRARLRAAGMIA